MHLCGGESYIRLSVTLAVAALTPDGSITAQHHLQLHLQLPKTWNWTLIHFTVYNVQCTSTLKNVQYTMYNVQCRCTMYHLQSKMSTVHCTLYIGNCILYTTKPHLQLLNTQQSFALKLRILAFERLFLPTAKPRKKSLKGLAFNDVSQFEEKVLNNFVKASFKLYNYFNREATINGAGGGFHTSLIYSLPKNWKPQTSQLQTGYIL